jgi:cytochrome c oxidase assembly protein subunit 11
MQHRTLSLKLVLLTVAMFGFGFALVPIYDVFCDLTGLGGRTSMTAATAIAQPDSDRRVRLEFVASVDRSAPFEFQPARSSMTLVPGEIYETAYFARNLTARAVTTRSVPSVAPGLAADYVKKIECFCFTEQKFDPDEGRDMGVIFMVDPELPEHIDTLTLSYALFAVEN